MNNTVNSRYLKISGDRQKSSRYREFEITSSYSAWIAAKGTESFVRVKAKFEYSRYRELTVVSILGPETNTQPKQIKAIRRIIFQAYNITANIFYLIL